MLISFFFISALPPPSRDPSNKPILERLVAVSVEERDMKFLLNDEFLHQFGLLHLSRSTHPYEVPDSPPKALDAPVSSDAPIPKEPAPEASLVKCSTTVDVAGSSGKFALAPVIEEEEPQGSPQRSQKSGEEAGKTSPVRQSGNDTFEGLSDLFATSQEIFKDDPITTRVSSSVVEATSLLQQTPLTQELTLTTPAIISPQLRSGL